MQKDSYISPILFNLGQHIKLRRIIKHMSQTALAHSCEMEKSTISKIEAGLVNIGYLSLDRISKCLGVTVCELIENKAPGN